MLQRVKALMNRSADGLGERIVIARVNCPGKKEGVVSHDDTH